MIHTVCLWAMIPVHAADNAMAVSQTVLAAGQANTDTMISLTAILAVALLAPILSFMTGKRIPSVVFLIACGVVIGPSVWGAADIDSGISILRQLGLGMLFLLAGYEMDTDSLRSKEGANAVVTWLMCLALAFAGALIFLGGDNAMTAVTFAIAVTSTALGTLLPILKQSGLLRTDVGKSVMLHGAIGELMPIMAIALLLSARSTGVTFLILVAFFAIAAMVAIVPRTVAAVVPWVGRAIIDGASATNQSIVRMVVLMLAILMTVAAVFDLDVVLGAFAAGIVLRGLVPDRARGLIEERLDVVGYGFFIPVFFVCSGISIDVETVGANLGMLFAVVGGILVARGLPVFARDMFMTTGSKLTTTKQKLQLGCYAATGLPIIVAVTEVARHAKLLDASAASLLVAGGAVTVLLFPLIAAVLQPKGGRE